MSPWSTAIGSTKFKTPTTQMVRDFCFIPF